MTLLQSIVLGITQGITEFLPISSSGHLILIPSILNWELQDLSFDVALHLGTAFAVLVYFWRDWFDMIIALKSDIVDFAKGKIHTFHELRRDTILLLTLIIVSIPVGIIGLLLESYIEEVFRSHIFVSFMLIVVSIYMFFADKFISKRKSTNENIKFIDYLIISLSQVVALFPGSSRSGMSISTGLFRGLTREKAARISFLLATPIILGASLLKVPDLFLVSESQTLIVFSGLISSFITGILAIKWLLNFVKNNSLMVFIIYRLILGVIILYYFNYAI